MKQWLRRLRGVLGMGAIWGVVGSLVGAGVGARPVPIQVITPYNLPP